MAIYKERACRECGAKFKGTCDLCHRHDPTARFQFARKTAKKRNKTWELTKEEYLSFITQPCYYCEGFFPKTIHGIGLDRLDNSRGYMSGNVVSCCYVCNMTRGETWTPEETRTMIQAAIVLRKKKGAGNAATLPAPEC